MESLTLTLSGTSSSLNASYYPEIELDKNSNYVCALVAFHTYNSIYNVNEKNNTLKVQKWYQQYLDITIPVGIYEINQIIEYIQSKLDANEFGLHLSVDLPSMKFKLKFDERVYVLFDEKNSIGNLLGFRPIEVVGDEGEEILSDRLIDINNINVLRIDCNIVTGSYINGKSSHTIHEFYPTVDKGYKINEVPSNLIYLPVVGQTISHLNIKIIDQNDNLVDFRGETITVRVHIKKSS